ncbi:MAG: hypothetical protein EBR23_09540 [Planctomycetia bacterium]|nr:hypothetical protein [Planctomycetia bacterium]
MLFMKNKTRGRLTILVVWCLIAFSWPRPTVEGGTMTWQQPQTIFSSGDVSVSGALAAALNIGPGGGTVSTTINGVTFTPWNFPAVDFSQSTSSTSLNQYTFTMTADAGSSLWSRTATSTAAPYSALAPEYKTLLATAGAAQDFDGSRPMTLTIGGLAIGQQYLFQWWSDRSDADSGVARATAGGVVNLSYNTTGSSGGVGQYGVGTFVADATTQNVVFDAQNGSTSGSYGWINGFQIRVVPEPSTTGLGALVMLAVWRCGAWRRRRRSG